MSAEPPPPPRRFLPWRSAATGWIVAAVVLVIGVPLFLCMPPWNDVTLHDMAVRAMLRGGVHYRDVFDTNLPGIDWAMAGVRAAFGWSYEVLRAFDLVVIAAEVGLLLGWVRRAGAGGAGVALASDFNPGSSPVVGLPLVMALGVSQLGLSHQEAVIATTVNAAAVLGLAADRGQLAPGFRADVVALEVSDWREAAFWLGANRVSAVWTAGSACPPPPAPLSLGRHGIA